MKTKIILYIIGIFLFCKINIAQEYPCGMPSPILRYNVPTNISGGYSDVEIMIYNQTQYFNREPSGPIRVLIIPVGAFFNGDLKYTPRSLSMFNHKLAGIEIIIPEQSSSSSPSFVSGNWDRTNGSENSQFSYGYGKYKFEFYRRVDDTIHGGYLWEFENYVYIDFRDTGPHFTPDSASGSMTDMRLDYFSKDTITYQFDARHNADNSNYKYKFWHINLVNKELKVWDKYGTCIPHLGFRTKVQCIRTHSASVGVPKSLLKGFREFNMLCANFLVTNRKVSDEESVLFKILKFFL